MTQKRTLNEGNTRHEIKGGVVKPQTTTSQRPSQPPPAPKKTKK